jgi:broad specificity phosphatase PhoE
MAGEPEFPLVIYLMRHGQSTWQLTRDRWYARAPLSCLGHAQASCSAAWLAKADDVSPGQIWTSPLLRARQTSEYLCNALKLPLRELPSLTEASFRVSDHLPHSQTPSSDPAPQWSPSAEYQNLVGQSDDAIQQLAEASGQSGKPILAVSHSGLIATMLRVFSGSHTVSFWINNASLHKIVWYRGRWLIHYLNRMEYLPPTMRTW